MRHDSASPQLMTIACDLLLVRNRDEMASFRLARAVPAHAADRR